MSMSCHHMTGLSGIQSRAEAFSNNSRHSFPFIPPPPPYPPPPPPPSSPPSPPPHEARIFSKLCRIAQLKALSSATLLLETSSKLS